MPRANRHYLPGYIWHITHRCHKKEFLLKFARDRRRYLRWLFEAKKRFGLSILNYIVTSNHIHLLVRDKGERDVIPNSMQLIAGRTAQEFNMRKNRKGAFWEDRYHATAVEKGSHLVQCLIYIDLNIVRAGIVRHPSDWPFAGYNEIQAPRERYALVDYNELKKLLDFKNMADLGAAYRIWVEDAIKQNGLLRDCKWTESMAVGSETFVLMTKEKLGIRAKGRAVIGESESRVLREPPTSYTINSAHNNDALRPENSFYWDHIP